MRFYLALFISALVLLQSCSSTNDVANDGLFQKRKYRKGLHGNFASKDIKKKSNSYSEAITEQNDDDALDQFDKEQDEANKNKKWWYKDEPFELANAQGDSSRLEGKLDLAKAGKERSIRKRLTQPLVGKRYQSVGANQMRKKLLQFDEPVMDVKTQGILSVVLGGLVIVALSIIPFVNITAAIVGMILGNEARNNGEESLGYIGWVISLIGLILSILWMLLYTVYALVWIGYIVAFILLSFGII